jgi:tetratricopeptide (TPR) repeat protein
MAYENLGIAFGNQGKVAEAEATFHKVIGLQPDNAAAYHNLGKVLLDQKKLKEAETAFRKAIDLQPGLSAAHAGLGITLREQKKLKEAAAALREADKLSPGDPSIQTALRRTERWLQLDQRLPEILAGTQQPRGSQERIEYASFCQFTKYRYVAAVRLYSSAFTADAKLAEDLRAEHRYNAACAATLAAAGKGDAAKGLVVEEWAWLQQQAFDWLRADLAVHATLAAKADQESRRFVERWLAHWQQDTDLIAVRDQEWLAAMPDFDRARWQQLWADVAALHKQAAAAPK